MTRQAAAATADLADAARAAWRQCADPDFAGHDPYDGLKSRLLAPLMDGSRLVRLAVIQGVKRCPVNLRPVLQIPRGHNPKGAALLLRSAAAWPVLATADEKARLVDIMAGLASLPDGSALLDDRAPRPGAALALADRAPEAAGWGYDFPWQSRAFLQPAYYPTVVCTSFVVDAFAAANHPAAATVIRAAAGFVTGHLHRHEDPTGVCYSYSPRDHTRVFNASLFAGKILARTAAHETGPEADQHREEAARVVDYVVDRQRSDGAWIYGEADHWQWIDGLHTGFVLETIVEIARLLGEPRRWHDALERGLAFYRAHLFGPDLTPYYYADRARPLDSHTVAQAALTFLALADHDARLVGDARTVLELGIARLYDPGSATFAFQRGRWVTDRTAYLRWSQAWMVRALATYLGRREAGA